ncbi:hypothetical protein ASD04_18640 [Devosia sp. Root436]|uniref:hypothetical protein n=1 Tax=unclassified Devosia TaxID=196773 RepID=UPI0006FD7769|nr:MULTISPECIES: hypothetical protein [unclassified Devosia]KQX41222.1 hypothetical protein ASD04_18640 [Devosia sp. Root436]
MSGSAAPARPASGSLSKLQLTAIISVDAFSGRFSFNALILTNRFRDTIMESGALFFTAGNLAAAAQLLAAPISRRMGLGCTMFCGRVPANLLLFLAALAPNFGIATACFTLCDFLSKLDVPTLAAIGLSQSGRKTAAIRFTLMSFSLAAAVAPLLTGWLCCHSRLQPRR